MSMGENALSWTHFAVIKAACNRGYVIRWGTWETTLDMLIKAGYLAPAKRIWVVGGASENPGQWCNAHEPTEKAKRAVRDARLDQETLDIQLDEE